MDEGIFGRAAQERAVAEVEAELARLCEPLPDGLAIDPDGLHDLPDVPDLHCVITLPLLVHGAETGAPGPARPVAVIHLLWQAASRRLDDLTAGPSPADTRRRTLTALAVGGQLPARLVAGLPVPPRVRAALADELSRAWLDAADGRLRDRAERPATATRESVLRGCEGRSGAPYAMAAASAACLAGAGAGRLARWRAFGRTLGVLRRLADDERDLASGRYETLAARTVPYLLVHLLEALPPARRREALALRAAARRSAAARAELAAWMLDDDALDSYAASVRTLAGRAHRLVDRLGGEPGCVRELHGLVGGTASRPPRSRLAAA